MIKKTFRWAESTEFNQPLTLVGSELLMAKLSMLAVHGTTLGLVSYIMRAMNVEFKREGQRRTG